MIEVLTRVAAPARADAIRSAIRERARALGFDAVGFATPDLPRDRQSAYRRFIAEGRHGDMAWLAREPERRQSPKGVWPEVHSIVVLGINYGPDEDPLAALARRDRATISVYARHRDYHGLIKGRLKQLAGWLHARCGAQVKVFADTAPVLEKPLARARRHRLAGQAQQPGLAPLRVLAVSRRDLHRPRARAGSGRRRPLRQLPRLPGRLPDRRFPCALPARRAALHLLSHDRAPRAHPARVPGADGQSGLRLRRLPRGLSLEQVRARGKRSQTAGARRSAGAAPGRAGPAR